MTVSPFDHPFLGGLLGDEETAGYFSAEADIRAMLAFETALAKAEARLGVIPTVSAERIAATAADFVPDMDGLRQGCAVDGVVVPALISQLRKAVGGEAATHVHFGATSQDVTDTSLMLRLKPVAAILAKRLAILVSALEALERRFGGSVLMGHTRMQAAIPITAGDRLRAWREPLVRHRGRLEALSSAGFALQFGGAAGTLDKLGDEAGAVRAALAEELGLTDAPQWQSQRDRLAELAGLLSLITGSLGKFGQDICLLAQTGDEIELAGGGGSSAMAHKQNPVAAETLVALSRFNALQLPGMHHALVHEQERSGAAWTLEWLTLPQMAIAAATALRLGVELAGNVRRLGKLD